MLFASLKIELIVDILIWHIPEVTRLVPLLGNTSNYVHAGKRIRQVQQSPTKKAAPFKSGLCRAIAVVAFVRCGGSGLVGTGSVNHGGPDFPSP
jgi:hypothetical protein